MATTPEDTLKTWKQASGARDLDTLVNQYETDAILVGPDGSQLVGRDAIREAFQALLASNPEYSRFDLLKTFNTGEVALFCDTWAFTAQGEGGDTMSAESKGTTVLKKQPDGTWLIAVDNPQGTA